MGRPGLPDHIDRNLTAGLSRIAEAPPEALVVQNPGPVTG